MSEENRQIAWFAPGGGNLGSISNLYTERVLPILSRWFDVDIFSENSEVCGYKASHPLSYYRKSALKRYICPVFLIEDSAESSFCLRSLRTIGGLGLFFDSNLNEE